MGAGGAGGGFILGGANEPEREDWASQPVMDSDLHVVTHPERVF